MLIGDRPWHHVHLSWVIFFEPFFAFHQIAVPQSIWYTVINVKFDFDSACMYATRYQIYMMKIIDWCIFHIFHFTFMSCCVVSLIVAQSNCISSYVHGHYFTKLKVEALKAPNFLAKFDWDDDHVMPWTGLISYMFPFCNRKLLSRCLSALPLKCQKQ